MEGPRGVAQKLLLTGGAGGVAAGALAAVALGVLTDSGDQWTGAYVMVGMYLGLLAGLVLAAANAVLARHLLRRRGAVPARARYAAVAVSAAAATALSVVVLHPSGTLVSLAIGAVVGVVTAELADFGYGWALAT